MVAGDERLGLGPVEAVVTGGVGAHRSIHAQIGQHDVVGAGKVQHALPIGLRVTARVYNVR